MSDGTDSELASLDESSHGNEETKFHREDSGKASLDEPSHGDKETRFHREDSEKVSLDESSHGDKGTISHMKKNEKASWDVSSYDDDSVDMTPIGSSTCNSNCKCHFDIDGRPQPPCYTCSMYNCFQADRIAEPSAPLEEGYPTAPPSYTQDVGPLHIQPEDLDKDAILMEAVAESNIKKVTHLLKFIHELDPDTVSVAHEVAHDIKNPVIIRLMDNALKKVTEKKSSVESLSANSCEHEIPGSSSMEAEDEKLTMEKQIKVNKELWTAARTGGDCRVYGKPVIAVKLVSNALHSGADINYRGDFGWTPLHGACYRGNAEPVKQLLEHININVNLQAKDGLTPLGLALKYKKHSIANALHSAGAVE